MFQESAPLHPKIKHALCDRVPLAMLYRVFVALALVASADAFRAGTVAPRALDCGNAAPRAAAPLLAAAESMPCAQPNEGGVLMNDVPISGTTLRTMELADANGGRARASDLIGEDGKAVVVFLRHLG